MTIEPIGKGSLALFIEPEEMDQIYCDDGGLDLKTAQNLVVSAFTECGLETEGSLELETYQGAAGIMLFARLVHRETKLYVFDSFEHVVAAAAIMPKPAPKCTLTYCDGLYYLQTDKTLSGHIIEFAREESNAQDMAGHLEEYGLPVSDDAIAELNYWFNHKKG